MRKRTIGLGLAVILGLSAVAPATAAPPNVTDPSGDANVITYLIGDLPGPLFVALPSDDSVDIIAGDVAVVGDNLEVSIDVTDLAGAAPRFVLSVQGNQPVPAGTPALEQADAAGSIAGNRLTMRAPLSTVNELLSNVTAGSASIDSGTVLRAPSVVSWYVLDTPLGNLVQQQVDGADGTDYTVP